MSTERILNTYDDESELMTTEVANARRLQSATTTKVVGARTAGARKRAALI